MADTGLQVVPPSNQLSKQETFAPRTLDEAIQFAQLIADSGMVPKDYVNKPGAIVVALQMGMEVGLQPMQALQSIAVINGRPSIWGDGALAIVKTHPEFAGIQEDNLETIKKNSKATCVVKRRGQQDVTVTFGQDDAITAGLWKKAGPWSQYPFRMMQMRARSFAIRDQFPDALKGIVTAEEAGDYSGETIEGQQQQSSSGPAADQKKAPEEETIGQAGGSQFYKVYKTSGHTPEEVKKWLADTLQIGEPHNNKDSRDIPLKEWTKVPPSEWSKGPVEGGRAWKFASTPAQIKVEALKKFADLGFTEDERHKFISERKVNWADIDKELGDELARRNAQESGQ